MIKNLKRVALITGMVLMVWASSAYAQNSASKTALMFPMRAFQSIK